MSDVDLDELRAELDDFAPAGEEGRPAAARGAHHRRFRGNPALRRDSTAARRSTARTATFSSGSMPCVSTACARMRTAVRCCTARPSGTAGRGGDGVARCADERSTTTNCLPNLEASAARRHHRASPRPHQRRQARGRGNRQSPEMRGLRQVQAPVRAGSKGYRRRHPADPSLRAEGRNQAGRVVHRRRPEGLCRRDGRDCSRTRRAEPMPGCA